MPNDDDPKTSTTTRPPPPGDDPYEVSTIVGEASADILAIVRQNEDDRASDAPTRVGPLPSDVAITAPPPPMPEAKKVERVLASHTAGAEPARPGLPPAVAITLLFAAVAAVLAAIVR